jgi:cytoskeletal protein RodZ
MESPGKLLKASRESRNLSLKEVSERTKIREHLLKAIEEDRYELLPSVYAKGFLNIYAKYLGLDPDEIILGYQKYLEYQTFTKETEVKQRLTFSNKRVGLWLFFISAIILSFGVLIYCFSLKPINHFLYSFQKKESKSIPYDTTFSACSKRGSEG